MARIRTVKPQFFLNEELAELSAMTRLFFIGLFCQADRSGRMLDRPKRLKAEIFPYDNFDADKGLIDLETAGFIRRYKVNANISDRILAPEQPATEVGIIQIITFNKHQKIDKANEKESELTSEEDYLKTISSLPKDGERKGKRKGKERNQEGKEAPDGLILPFATKEFSDLWEKLCKEKKWKNKSAAALESSLEKLGKHTEAVAIEMIKNAIGGEWQGLVEIKENAPAAAPAKTPKHIQIISDHDDYVKNLRGSAGR